MSSTLIYIISGILLWLLGLLGLLLAIGMLRRVIALNLMGSGVFMVLVSLAERSQPNDPVLHALVVTGLVVAISATAFALRLTSAGTHHERGGDGQRHSAQGDDGR